MKSKTVEIIYLLLAGAFAAYFTIVVVPPLIANPNVIAAFAAGFVNPYASGYAMDTILCGVILSVWVIYESSIKRVKYGLLVLPLILLPGVATAFGVYLVLRARTVSLAGKES